MTHHERVVEGEHEAVLRVEADLGSGELEHWLILPVHDVGAEDGAVGCDDDERVAEREHEAVLRLKPILAPANWKTGRTWPFTTSAPKTEPSLR